MAEQQLQNTQHSTVTKAYTAIVHALAKTGPEKTNDLPKLNRTRSATFWKKMFRKGKT